MYWWGAAETFVGLEIAEAVYQVFAGEIGGIPDKVVARKAGAMREKVARSSLLAGNGIVHLKFGEIAADGLVPIHFAFIFENGEGERGERFCDGADGEKRGGGDGELLFEVVIAVAFGVDDFGVLHDGEGNAGNFPLLHGVSSEVVEALQLGGGSCDGNS